MADNRPDIASRAAGALAAVAAGFVTRKAMSAAWKKATGKEPPTNPEDPRVALAEALGWSALVGITMATVRVLAVRAVSRKNPVSADSEPANAADG